MFNRYTIGFLDKMDRSDRELLDRSIDPKFEETEACKGLLRAVEAARGFQPYVTAVRSLLAHLHEHPPTLKPEPAPVVEPEPPPVEPPLGQTMPSPAMPE